MATKPLWTKGLQGRQWGFAMLWPRDIEIKVCPTDALSLAWLLHFPHGTIQRAPS